MVPCSIHTYMHTYITCYVFTEELVEEQFSAMEAEQAQEDQFMQAQVEEYERWDVQM